jgi:hypothetical protein
MTAKSSISQNDVVLERFVNVLALRRMRILLLGSWVAISIGCTPSDEPSLGTVTGKVSMDGKPLANVWVGFAPAEGRASMAITDKEGHYKLNYLPDKPGAKVGPHKVAITTPEEDEFGGSVKDFREVIPSRYNRQTELTAEVKSGHNELNFVLTMAKGTGNAGAKK